MSISCSGDWPSWKTPGEATLTSFEKLITDTGSFWIRLRTSAVSPENSGPRMTSAPLLLAWYIALSRLSPVSMNTMSTWRGASVNMASSAPPWMSRLTLPAAPPRGSINAIRKMSSFFSGGAATGTTSSPNTSAMPRCWRTSANAAASASSASDGSWPSGMTAFSESSTGSLNVSMSQITLPSSPSSSSESMMLVMAPSPSRAMVVTPGVSSAGCEQAANRSRNAGSAANGCLGVDRMVLPRFSPFR